ncbi:MAG: hypothetical protein CMJ75_19240 [Planctomycetaceae bacterium]|nr:hypothetical protein [Planctomycetaceae bacterium]
MPKAPLSPLENALANAPSFGIPSALKTAAPGAALPGNTQPGGDPSQFMPLFEKAAKTHQVPINVLLAIAEQESSFNPAAIGPPTKWGQARGMMQYLDSTAQGMGIDALDPAQSIDAAAKQLAERLRKGYTMDDAVMEHFAGPDRNQWGPKTAQYGLEVMNRADRFAELYQPSNIDPSRPPSPLTFENQQQAMLEQMNAAEPGRYSLPPEQGMGINPEPAQPSEQKLEAWEPTLWEQAKGLFAPNKDAATVELAMREGAKEKGISVNEAYRQAGGARPVYNPEGRAPVQAASEAIGVLAPQAKHILPAAANTVMRAMRNGDVDMDANWLDNAIDATTTKPKVGEHVDPNYESFQGIGESLGFSLVNMGAAALASIGGTAAAGPVGGAAAGLGASAGVAYRASRDQFLDRVRENYFYTYMKMPTQEQWEQIQQDVDAAATKYGAFEAVPESIGSMIFVRALSRPLAGASRAARLADAAGRVGQTQASEQVTELATGIGQNRAEIEANLTDEEKSAADVFREQALNVLITTGLMSGAGMAGRAAYDATPMGKRQREQAAVEQEINDSINAWDGNLNGAPKGPLGRATEAVIPTGMNPEDEPAANPAPLTEQPDILADQTDSGPRPRFESDTTGPFGEVGARVTVAAPGMDAFEATVEGYVDGDIMVRDASGSSYQLPMGDQSIVIESIAQEGAAETQATAETEATPAPQPTAEPAPQERPANYDDMAEQELRDRLKYLGAQAKNSGGWNKTLIAEREKIERAIAKFKTPDQTTVKDAAPAEPESQPAEPVKWFGSQDKADAWVAKQKNGAFRVVENNRRFEVYPETEQTAREPDGQSSVRLPGDSVENGFKAAPDGGRYRVGVVRSVGGAVSLERRLTGGTAATFYVGKDGNLIDGDNVSLNNAASRDRLWVPANEAQAQEAASILDEMGRTALDDPKRKEIKSRLKSLVEGSTPAKPEKNAQQAAEEVLEQGGTEQEQPADLAAGTEVLLGKGRRAGTVLEADATHVNVRTGDTAEKMTRAQFDRRVRDAEQTPEAPQPRQGKVGDAFAAGEVALTSSGRQTTPFPKVDTTSDRKAGNTVKRVEQWLMQNALAEAQSRGDEFNALQFEANQAKPSQADKDAAEEYLFGQQPDVVPSILKPMTPRGDSKPKKPLQEAQEAAGKVLEQGGTEQEATRAATDALIDRMGDDPSISISEAAPKAVEEAKQRVIEARKAGDGKAEKQAVADLKAAKSTAPEHAAVGVDDRELSDIVSEFNEYQQGMIEDGDKVHHLFDAPKKNEIVRLQDKVKVYREGKGWMTVAEAKAEIAKWKEHAHAQAKTHRRENNDRVVLSFFDLTGKWSQPWEDAGYQVYRFDIQDDPEVGDVNNFSAEFFGDWFGDFEGNDIYAILAACPCTDFASSGSRHFAAKDEDGRTVASVRLVHQTLAAIEYFKPAIWAIENPVGRIEKLGGLPPWRLSFDPNHIGDPYTKKTLLWGRFNADMPIAPVEPTEGSKMHSKYGGKSLATKNARSATPEGFSYGFFMANNAVDHPAMAIANKFDRLDRDLIERAVKAGVTESEITEAVEDFYYMDLDDDAANAAIQDLIDERSTPEPEPEPTPKAPAKESGLSVQDQIKNAKRRLADVRRVRKDNSKAPDERERAMEREIAIESEIRGLRRQALSEEIAQEEAESTPRNQSATTESKAKPAVTENKLFTEDAAEKARAIIRAKLAQVNTGVDPELLQAGIALAGYHIEKGARTFAAYAKAMTDDMGDMVRPYLKSWFMAVKYDPRGATLEGMSSAAEVEAYDVNEGASNEPESVDQSGAGALARTPAGNVQDAEPAGAAERGAENGSGADTRGNERAGSGRNDNPRSVGNGQGAVSVPASGSGQRPAGERGGRAVQRSGTDPESDGRAVSARQKPVNYRIDPEQIGQGGAKTKYRNNVAAIRLLRQLQTEQRPATRDEQDVLAKYVGWGGIPQAFERTGGAVSDGWAKEVAELKELLTPEEMSAARASTRNAHYTSPQVVTAMWQAMERLGFKGGKLLEPSVGAGNFFGLMPDTLRHSTALHGVELDNLTGAIATHLYPNAKIATPMGFQDYDIPNGYFDAAIGNPPFGSEKLYDGKRKDLSGFSIHNYFFAKTIDALAPNGVMAMVVTNRMMDVAGDKARQYMNQRAELLGAIRLPNDAFKANAGTEVTTDILFLRKREEGEAVTGESWMEVKDYTDSKGIAVPLNEYFHRHPDMMLGEFGAYGSMHSPTDPALIARSNQDTVAELAKAIAKLPQNVARRPKAPVAESVPDMREGGIPDVKVGSLFIDGDKVRQREPDSLGERQASDVVFPNAKAQERVVGMIGVRDALAEVRRLQLSDAATDRQIEAARKQLNKAYDAFVKKNGPINADANKRLFRDDPTWPQIAALEENFDKGISAAVAKKTGETPRAPSADKAAVFSKRTQAPYRAVDSVNSAKDALVTSLAETGRVDLSLMRKLYGKSEAAILKELGDLVFQDPQKGIVTRDEYLSGNVKAKLAEAKRQAAADPAWQKNVEALEAVQPKDIEAVDINVKPGAHWVPSEDMKAFVAHVSGDTRPRMVYNPATAGWLISGLNPTQEATQQFGTGRASPDKIIQAALNQKTLAIYDEARDGTRTLNETETDLAQKKVEAVKEQWREWIWSDDARRERLARLYNDTFNTDVQRVYDGSHLTLPGKVGDDIIKLRPHQLNAVWRIIQSDTTLTDHVVGAGKTFTLIAGAMELRRMGLARKPMFVVPNHLVGQWAVDFTKLYPGANVLAATKKDFEKENRKKLFARIATGDWDAVIVAHSSFGKVQVDPQAQGEFIEGQIADLTASMDMVRSAEGAKSRNVKQLEDRVTKLREKLKRLFDAENKDDSLFFSELGVDALFLDEAHEFKNLAFSSSMNRVAGLGNQQGSQKAADMFMKTQMTLKATGGRNVVFATGTPISNTMAEMFTMQRYLDYTNLRERGLAHFDAWARMFGEVVTDWEISPAGVYKMNSRFAKFVNMPELMQSYNSFADVVNRDDINRMLASQGKKLPVPKVKGGKPENIVVTRSPMQARYIGLPVKDADGNDTDQYEKGSLIWRAENLPKKAEKGADNMLKIMSDARKAALDMRLIDPSAPDFPGSKVNVAADRIKADYETWNADRGTQLVFIDLSTPKKSKGAEAARIRKLIDDAESGDEAAQSQLDAMSPDEFDALNSSFSVYDDLKQKLIDRGIPENEIAFIHDANTELQKEELYGKVRSGRIRVLLGSTAKMGAGMNVQNRLVGLHHLDAPWRPSDLEQREGRIIRQGNELYERDPEGFEVAINRYATKETLDSRMWQTIEGKANFIEQVRKGTGSREVEDVGAESANAAEMKAASSGNPLILEEMTLRQQIRKLETEQTGHEREQHRLRDQLAWNRRTLEYERAAVEVLRADAKRKVPEEFTVTIDGAEYDKRADAGAAIIAYAEAMGDGTEAIGQYGEFTIELDKRSDGADVGLDMTLKGDGDYTVSFGLSQDPQGLGVKLSNAVKNLADKVAAAEAQIQRAERDIPKLEAMASPVWPRRAELDALREKHEAVIEQLRPKKREAQQEGGASASVGEPGKLDRRSLESTLKGSQIGSIVDALLASGKLQLHETPASIPNSLGYGVAGQYNGDGIMHLAASNLRPESAVPVLMHEIFHGGVRSIIGDAQWKKLIGRLGTLRQQAIGSRGPVNDLHQQALRRITRAEAGGVRMNEAQRNEEFGAYLVEEYEKLPKAYKSWVNEAMGAVKAFLLKHFGVQLGKVTPEQLRSLTMAALRSTRPVDGGTPAVASTDAFNRWFGKSILTVDGKPGSEPIRLYHGTSDDITAFDLNHPNRKDTGWLGTGVYLTDKADMANTYANIKGGAAEPNVMPLYGRLENPYMATLADKKRLMALGRQTADNFTKELQRLGHDGVILEFKDVREIVIFDPAGVKSAIGNNGAFDPNNPDIRASVTAEDMEVQAPTKAEIDGFASRLLTRATPTLLAAAPMDRMIEEVGKRIPALQMYLRSKRAMDAYRSEKHGVYDEVAQRWLKFNTFNRKAAGDLADIMHESTIAQVDPSAPYKTLLSPRDQKALEQGEGPLFEAALGRAAKDRQRKEAYEDLRARYNALPEGGKKLYREIRDTYKAQSAELDQILLDNVSKALDLSLAKAERKYKQAMQEVNDDGLTGEERQIEVDRIEKEYTAAKTKQAWNKRARLTQMRKQFESNRLEGPYFPLARFGDYFVTARDAKTKEVVSFSRFENPTDQQKFAAEMRKAGRKVEVGYLYNSSDAKKGVDPRFIADVEDILSASDVDDQVKDQVWQRYLESMPDLSMRKKFIHRKGRAGYSGDALRAFGSQMFHASHQMARLKYAQDMAEYIEQAKEQAKQAADPTRAAMVVNEVEKRNAFVMNPKGGWFAQAVTSAAFVYYLGVTPAAAIVNASQTVVMGVPILGNEFGLAKTQAALMKATMDFTFGRGSIKNAKISSEERVALEQAYATGLLQRTQSHDLAGVGETGVEYSALRTKVMGAISWIFHHTERFNREVTFTAAYRLAREKGMDTESAFDEASRLTWKTHFDYANTNRPRLMHSDTAKVLLVFRNYQVNMLYRLARDSHQAFSGATPAERKEALRQLGGISAIMAMNAGVTGTWLFGAFMLMMGLFWDDPEEELKKGVIGAIGPTAGGMLLYGIPGHVTGTNLSERIGMPDLWFRSADKEMEGKEAFGYWQSQLLGAAPGIVERQVVGFNMLLDGHAYRGIETMAPKFIRDLMRSGRYAKEGVLTMKGDEVVGDLTPAELFWQAMGFTPAVVAERYSGNRAMYNKQQRIMSERSKIQSRLALAEINGDDTTDLMEKLYEFNDRYPEYPITVDTLRQSIDNRQRASARMDGGVILNPKLERRIKEESAPSIYR